MTVRCTGQGCCGSSRGLWLQGGGAGCRAKGDGGALPRGVVAEVRGSQPLVRGGDLAVHGNDLHRFLSGVMAALEGILEMFLCCS